MYHKVMWKLIEEFVGKLIDWYGHPHFLHWLATDSEFGTTYKTVFHTSLQIQLNPEQEIYLYTKGRNLEKKLFTWLRTWQDTHQETELSLPFHYITIKVQEHIIRQFQRSDIRALCGMPC